MPAAGVEPALNIDVGRCWMMLCQIPCQNLKLFELRSEIICVFWKVVKKHQLYGYKRINNIMVLYGYKRIM